MPKRTLPHRFAFFRPATLAATLLLCACANAQTKPPPARAELIARFEHAPLSSLPRSLAYKIQSLAELSPENPLPEDMAPQTLSLFGREDLIASTSHAYRPTACAALAAAPDMFEEIVRRAQETSIVIVNESHERSEHRAFTAALASRLRPLGYNMLAMEALSNPVPGTLDEHLPAYLKRPGQPFLEDEDGFYLSESAFGRLGRQAKALGLRLLPYEFVPERDDPGNASPEAQIATREEEQARNLAAFITGNPGSKLLIHVGYSHAAEAPRAGGARWMALRLKEKTGIDPLTISQTTCRGGGKAPRLSILPATEPAGSFDLLVDHPTARFTHGRPHWRILAGDQAVTIPISVRPAAGWRVVEARPVGEPPTSVPIDRVAIRPEEDVALMLPPGRYSLRIIDVPSSSLLPKPATR